MKRITVSFARDVFNKVMREEITFSKCVELLNEETGLFDTIQRHKMTGVDLISQKRWEQVNKHGFNRNHDDKHTDGELTAAACVYADMANYHGEMDLFNGSGKAKVHIPRDFKWPFDKKYLKLTPNDRVNELSKAGAFIAAEIDRLNRLDEI
jgi:hypothetical protein